MEMLKTFIYKITEQHKYNSNIGCVLVYLQGGTKLEDVPEDFECPICNVGKDQFSEVE